MVQIKGREIERFLNQPSISCVLLYGPDAGLVSERAEKLAKIFTAGSGDDFSISRLDGDSIADDPGRIATELGGSGLFSDKAVLRIRIGSANLGGQVSAALDNGIGDGALILEAGDIKPTHALRKLAEKRSDMASLAAYVDTQQSINSLIDEEIERQGLRIDRDTRQYLAGLLGADRRSSRNELKKLALYSLGKDQITIEDVQAVVSDASTVEFDQLINAIGDGDLKGVERELSLSLGEGVAPVAHIIAIARHFSRLATARQMVETGATAESAMKKLRPPVFFKQEASFRRQLNRWSSPNLLRAQEKIGERDFAIRQKATLAEPLLRSLTLELALYAQRGR